MCNALSITAILPAKDEQYAIGDVIAGLAELAHGSGESLFTDIIVCDNGSSDDTAMIARSLGARVVFEETSGYGSACLAALSLVQETTIVVFVDADGSVSPNDIKSLIAALMEGADLVIGIRPRHLREPNSMSLPQRFGNQLASLLIKFLWGQSVSDLGPLRAIRWERLKELNMQDKRFGWTVEMQVKAIQHNYLIREVPVRYRKQVGTSKISGTLRGVILAGWDIIYTILRLRFRL